MILEASGVNQSFRTGFWLKRTQILHDVSVSVPNKGICGFLGENGAGKTTLIHLIVGLRRPTSGSVRVCGLDAHLPQARSKIGYLPERPYFHEHLTGQSFLEYFGTLSGLSKATIQSRIPVVLERVGMGAARKVELKRYSKGMLQRIGIAQAILHDPELLILDEPMSGLDPVGRKEMRELILQLAAEGRTIFFSSHVIPDVEAICDQVTLIRKGRILGCGPIGQFLSKGPLTTELALSGITLEQARALPELEGVREIPDGIRATVSGQLAVHAALERLLAIKSVRIHWVNPIRPTLETFFESRRSES